MHEAMRFRLVADDKGWTVHTAVKPTPGMEVEFTVTPIKQPQAERFCTISSLPWHECSYEEPSEIGIYERVIDPVEWACMMIDVQNEADHDA